jgi:outer membrane protein assembly factor BamB
MHFKKGLTHLLAIGALASLVGCAGEEDTVIMAPVPVVSSEFSPTNQWSSTVGTGVEQFFSKLEPTLAYDNLYVASRMGTVKALEPSTGKVIWENDISDGHTARLSGGIHAAYGQLFIGSENGEVISLDAESGELKWRESVQGEVLSMPTTESNLVFVHTSRGLLIALDEETGEQAWTVSTEVPSLTLRGTSAPVAAAGAVFWGTANGRLAAAVIERGQLIWQQPVGTPKGATEIDRLVDVDATPIILSSTLYTIGINGQLIAIDLRSGNPSWKRNYSTAVDMATDGRVLYLVTDQDHMVAVDARSGTELWTNELLENRLLTAPKIIDGFVVVGDAEGYLHWVDRDSGTFVAQQLEHESGFAVGPLQVDDGYVIQTRNGALKKLTIK